MRVDLARFDQRADVVQQLLAAFDRKGGDDEVAAALQRLVDLGPEGLAALRERIGRTVAPAIGGLADDVIKACRRVGFLVEHLLVGAEVA